MAEVPSLRNDAHHVAKADTGRVAELMHDYSAHIHDAAAAHDEDKHLTTWQAIKKYKKAVAWSMALSTALIMEGYDLVIITSFYGQKQFQQKYGTLGADGKYFISAPWQTGLSNSALCGQILGLVLNGFLSQRIGYRRTMMIAMAFMAAAIFIVFFAPSLAVLSFGEVMCGLPWGVFQTLSTSYAADVCPTRLRPLLTSYVNMCWGAGILLSSGVARAAIDLNGSTAYKLPFALQWIWPAPLFAVAYFAPESPYWLVRTGKREEAVRSVQRLTQASTTSRQDCERHVALLEHTDALERAQTEGTSYLDCFRGPNRRRTEIACAVWAIQWWCGNPLIGFAVTFLEQAGFDETKAFDLNLGMNTMYIVGTVVSWFLMSKFGRRSMYLGGLVFMGAVCLGIAIAGFVKELTAVGALMVILNFAYNISIGPVCYCIVAEIGSSRLRPLVVVLARITYNLTGLVTNTITPRMIQPTAWGWGARCGLFWVGTATISFVYCALRLPETKDRTTGELDVLFENRVSAWRFKGTEVELFNDDDVQRQGVAATQMEKPGSFEQSSFEQKK